MLVNRIILIALFLFPAATLKAASGDTLNRYNTANKKDGFWTVYLDSLLKPVDITQSYFFAYEQFDNGTEVFTFKQFPFYDFPKNYTFAYTADRGQKGKPVLLHGSFRIYFPQGWKYKEQTFSNGRPVEIRFMDHEKNNPDVAYSQTLSFDRLYNGQSGSYYYEEKESGSLIASGYFRKGENGWKNYPEK